MSANAPRAVHLKSGRAKPLWSGHPWVFADSIQSMDDVEDGSGVDGPEADWVRVLDADQREVGRGLLSETSAIRVRILSFGAADRDASSVLEERVAAACTLRQRLFPDLNHTNAYRLIHSEGDGLPGLVVDRWDDVLVAQFATAPMARRREALAEVLLRESGARALIARPGGFEREEGLPSDPMFTAGDAVQEAVDIIEGGCRFRLDPQRGQKTGHFADQRENRQRVAEVAGGARVLDLYAGTGGFSLAAMAAGADACIAIDVSQRSVEALRANAILNEIDEGIEAHTADVSDMLGTLRAAKQRFDLVIADPPNFFPRRGDDRSARKAYRELNVRALSRVRGSGGFLATFSCSPRLDAPGLLAMLQSAARECRRTFRVLRELTAGPDHPVAAGAPHSRYLSGLLVAVDPDAGVL